MTQQDTFNMIEAAIESLGARMNDIADVAKTAIEVSRSNQTAIAKLQTQMESLNKTLDRLVGALENGQGMSGRIVRAEEGIGFVKIELANCQRRCSSKWKYVVTTALGILGPFVLYLVYRILDK